MKEVNAWKTDVYALVTLCALQMQGGAWLRIWLQCMQGSWSLEPDIIMTYINKNEGFDFGDVVVESAQISEHTTVSQNTTIRTVFLHAGISQLLLPLT